MASGIPSHRLRVLDHRSREHWGHDYRTSKPEPASINRFPARSPEEGTRTGFSNNERVAGNETILGAKLNPTSSSQCTSSKWSVPRNTVQAWGYRISNCGWCVLNVLLPAARRSKDGSTTPLPRLSRRSGNDRGVRINRRKSTETAEFSAGAAHPKKLPVLRALCGSPNKGCSSESVSQPVRCPATTPKSPLTTAGWWPMPACSCRPPWPTGGTLS